MFSCTCAADLVTSHNSLDPAAARAATTAPVDARFPPGAAAAPNAARQQQQVLEQQLQQQQRLLSSLGGILSSGLPINATQLQVCLQLFTLRFQLHTAFSLSQENLVREFKDGQGKVGEKAMVRVERWDIFVYPAVILLSVELQFTCVVRGKDLISMLKNFLQKSTSLFYLGSSHCVLSLLCCWFHLQNDLRCAGGPLNSVHSLLCRSPGSYLSVIVS